MVWKQDLSKLKQAFREAGGPPPPPVKPKPKPVEVKDLNDEDAMFLAAMGGSAPQGRPVFEAPPVVRPAVEAPAPDLSFEAGLTDLKGLRPLAKAAVLSAPVESARIESARIEPAVVPQPSAVEPAAETAPVAPPAAPEPAAAAEVLAKSPLRIQLAAGMAVEVDASLDLRGHSVQDALGRLRDRVEDGAHMGWRTLHVVLGEDPALHEALLDLLAGSGGLRIGRYAQAPIPMGGAQAWVLYY